MKKIFLLVIMIVVAQGLFQVADANRDKVYCKDGWGYFDKVTSGNECNGGPCSHAPPGTHYPGYPKRCSPGDRETMHYATYDCPVCTPPCVPTWGSYGACDKSCGGGKQWRKQTCTGTWQSRSCNTHSCCVNTATYGECSEPCGTGTQSYKDTCTGKIHTRYCNAHECPSCESGYDASSCELQDEALTTGLCAAGTPNNFIGAGTEINPWTWTCDGSGLSESCCAKINAGSCGDDDGETYEWEQANFPPGFDFCNPDSAVSTPPFVNLKQLELDNPVAVTTTWSCSTVNGGTETEECNATLNPPGVECGIANNESVTNIKPSVGLCKDTTNNVIPPVTLVTGGRWTWGCQHSVFPGIVTNPLCSTPSCIANNPINATNPIMLSEDMKSRISLNCPGSTNLCCTIDSVPYGTTNITDSITVCSNKTGEIEIEAGVNTLPAECWFEEDCDPAVATCNPTCNAVTETCVDVNGPSVSTACMESQCTASGTCAKAPVIGADKTACKSSCNSNADCSSGRMIETKP